MMEENAVGRLTCNRCTAAFETSLEQVVVPEGWLVKWSLPPGAGTEVTGRLLVLCPEHSGVPK